MGNENCSKCGGKGYNIEQIEDSKTKDVKNVNRHCWDCDGRGYIKVEDKEKK